jgi:hypothetical protein
MAENLKELANLIDKYYDFPNNTGKDQRGLHLSLATAIKGLAEVCKKAGLEKIPRQPVNESVKDRKDIHRIITRIQKKNQDTPFVSPISIYHELFSPYGKTEYRNVSGAVVSWFAMAMMDIARKGDESLFHLGVDIKAINALLRSDVSSLSQLREKQDNLPKFRNIGPDRLEAISHGLEILFKPDEE